MRNMKGNNDYALWLMATKSQGTGLKNIVTIVRNAV